MITATEAYVETCKNIPQNIDIPLGIVSTAVERAIKLGRFRTEVELVFEIDDPKLDSIITFVTQKGYNVDCWPKDEQPYTKNNNNNNSCEYRLIISW